MASGQQEIVNQLCKIVEESKKTTALLKASEDRTIDVYFVTVPENGGTRTFATGITKIDFSNGQIINPDGTVEQLSRRLDLVQDKDVMHSVSIHCSNAPIKFSLDTSGLQTVQQEFLFQLPYVTFRTMQITCTEETEISIFACTNPQATLGNFRLTQITDISQPYIVADDPELTTWPASLVSLSDNMSRIRNQIISITGESWGTVSNSIASILSTITGHDHDGTDSKKVSAGNVVNTPAGNIVAVEVQAAIDELDGQDTTIQGNLTTHMSDTSTHGVNEVADVATVSAEIDSDILTHKNGANEHHAQSHNVASHSDTTVTGAELDADHSKLGGIEADAKDDQTGAEIKTLYEGEADTNEFSDAEKTKLGTVDSNADVTGSNPPQAHEASHESGGGDELDFDQLAEGTTYKKFLATERTKLTGIDTGAKDDQTGAEIKALYEAEADTNAYDDNAVSKLGGIEGSADITDAGNIASSIVGVDAKATPVNADTIPIIDSADANSLKEVLWSQIKATLKTYFDTLYDTLGGLSTHESDTSTHGVATVAGLAETQTFTKKIIELDDALAGDHTYEGITTDDTVGENVAFGDILYMKSDGKWWKSSSAVADSAEFPVAAMAVATINADAAGKLLLVGTVYDVTFNFTTIGTVYGGVDVPTPTKPSTTGHTAQIIGVSLDVDRMIFNPDYTYVKLA